MEKDVVLITDSEEDTNHKDESKQKKEKRKKNKKSKDEIKKKEEDEKRIKKILESIEIGDVVAVNPTNSKEKYWFGKVEFIDGRNIQNIFNFMNNNAISFIIYFERQQL